MQGVIIKFDRAVAGVVQKLPQGLEPVMSAATFVGLPAVIITLAAVVAVAGWVKGQPRIAYAMVASVVALGGNTILKHVVHRARPDTMYVANMKIHSYSFPSGHAFGAVVIYGLLAYLAYTHLPAPYNLIFSVALVCLVILIGISRVFLGAHFPSDVLTGWVLGAVCLFLIITFIKP